MLLYSAAYRKTDNNITVQCRCKVDEMGVKSDMISESCRKLSEITEQTPIDWEAFDTVLEGLEDINIIDKDFEETILSELILGGDFWRKGEDLPNIVRRFLAHGYDVSAHDGVNGGYALSTLCWSSYDRHLLDAAKVLMKAGAIVKFKSDYDEGEEPEGLFGSIGWKLSGAWAVDHDFKFANILEAYYAMAKAYDAGKDYNSIDSYFACIGKTLTAVCAVKNETGVVLREEGMVLVYTEPMVLWFGDKPLVASCYTDFVVNPVFVDDNQGKFDDVTCVFADLVGATLEKVQYMGTTISCLEFSNGRRLLFASRDIGNRERVGTFEIRGCEECSAIETLGVKAVCGIDGYNFGSNVATYSEEALALFCDSGTYLLYVESENSDKCQLKLCRCTEKLAEEYDRQFPVGKSVSVTGFYEEGDLTAVRMNCPEGYLYLLIKEYDQEIDVQLSDKLYDPLEYSGLPGNLGKHLEFKKKAI